MNDEEKLKIVLIGPVSTGKTAIANFLSELTENKDNSGGGDTVSKINETRPTKGVRIVEFFIQGVRTNSVYKKNVEVELWDCSGDNRYQSCWPAVQHRANGIIFVYTEDTHQQKSALNTFYDRFVEKTDFPDSRCLVLKNQLGVNDSGRGAENPLPGLHHTVVNIEERGVDFKKCFNSFLSTVLKSSSND